MAKLLTRALQKKFNFQITLKLVKISAPDLDNEIDFVDLGIVWKRGP